MVQKSTSIVPSTTATSPEVALADAAPEDLGFSREALDRIDTLYRERVAAGEMAGFVYAVARRGRVVRRSAIGHADIESGREMALDTVFRLASMTKPITAVALMILYQEGKFGLDDPVADYLPEFAEMRVLPTPTSAPEEAVPAERPITIRHLLQHRAGFGLGLGIGATGEALLVQARVYDPDDDLADEMRKLSRVPLCYQPGTVWNYSLSPDVQARLVEVLSGEDFEAFVQSRILGPLGMNDTGFTPLPNILDRMAAIYWPDGERLAAWHDESVPPVPPIIPAWPEPFASLHDASIRYVRGSFGLYSTLEDYLRFAQMLLNGGVLGDVRILSEETVRLMSTDSLGEAPMLWPVQGLGFGLGFAVLRDAATAGYSGSPGVLHWDGALGTIMWIDPANELVVVGMAQHFMIPTLTPDALGAEMRNHVYAALIE